MGEMTRSGRSSALTRKVLAAMGVFGSVELLSMLCAVVRTKLVAIWIGAAGIGLIGLYSTAIELLSAISQLSLRTTAVRDISAAPHSLKEKTIAVVSHYGNRLALAGVILTIILSPLLSLATFGDTAHILPFIILGLAVGCNTVVATRSAILQGRRQLMTIAKASAIATLLSLAAAVPMVWLWRLSAIVPVLLTYSCVTLIVYLASGRSAAPLVVPPRRQRRAMARDMLRLGLYLTVSGVVTWLVSYVVMSWLNWRGGEELMGFYQSGYTVAVRYVGVVFTALSLEYFPRLSAAFAGGLRRGQLMLRHEILIALSVVTALCAIMIPLAPLILRLLYSPGFVCVAPMIAFAAPGVALRAISWAMGFVILARGSGRLFLFTEIASALISLLAVMGGYELGGLAGLGVGFTLWYLAYALIVAVVLRRRLQIGLGSRVRAICVAAVLLLTLLAISTTLFPPLATAIAGAVVALLSLALLSRLFLRR